MKNSFNTKQRLELFIKRTEELLNLRYVNNGMGSKINLKWNAEDMKMTNEIEEPDKEELRSFLLLFRQFISNDEPIFINRIFNDCEKCLIDDSIKKEVRELRNIWEKIFRKLSPLVIVIDGKRLTSEYVLDLWINGDYFHNDPQKMILKEILSRNSFSLDKALVFSSLPGLVEVILSMGRGLDKCLQHNKFIFSDES